MENSIDKRINISNKIFPIFYGLSSDLIFFIEINTLFLTSVKGLTSYEINLITTIGILVSLLFYLFSHKIINKIGNLYSIRLGNFLSLISAILFTFSTKIIFFVLILLFIFIVIKLEFLLINNKNKVA